MIDVPDRGTVEDVLRNLHAAQLWIDREATLPATGARLAQVISELEDWVADSILQAEARHRPTR